MAAKKKRKKARSGSSSSSSSSSEERAGKAAKSSKMKVDKSYEKMMDIMVSAVKNVEEKVKELSKNTKKSQQKVETDCQIVRDRVGEMTIAVQVIAENLDSVNDVGKKIEVLDTIQSGLSKLGSLDRLVERLEGQRTGAAPVMTVTTPVPVPELAREGGWEGEQPERREPPPVDLSNMVQEVVARVDKKLCEFGSMIEGNLDRIERELKLDSGGPGKMKTLVDVTKALSSNSLKVLEVVKKTEKRFDTDPALMALGGPPIPPPPSNDYRLRELGDRVGEVLPKLDDIYIRVLPALEDIKQRARKESERENLTLKEIREQQVKVEKIMDMVEDMKEARGEGGGSMDSKIKASLAEDSVQGKLDMIEETVLMMQQQVKQSHNAMAELRTFAAKQTSLDKIERLLLNKDENEEGQSRVNRHLDRVLEFLKKNEKTLDMLMKNSASDAKLLSQCNTSLQGMKAAVSGNGKEVISAVQAVAETVRGVEESLRVVGQDVGGLGGSLDEMGGQVRGLERDGGACSGLEGLAKVQSALERLGSKVGALGGGLTTPKKKEGGSKEEAKLENASELASRMDELHDLVAGNGESFSKGLAAVQQDVNKHDKNIGLAVKTLVGLLKASVDSTKKNSIDLDKLDKLLRKEVAGVGEKIDSGLESVKVAIGEEEAGVGKTGVEVLARVETVGGRVETLAAKMDKLQKTVGRIKYLVEDDEEGEEEGEGGGSRKAKKRKAEVKAEADPYEFAERAKVDLSSLERKLDEVGAMVTRDLEGRRVEEVLNKIGALEDKIVRRVEDELERSSGLITDNSSTLQNVRDIVREIGDRMVTRRNWDSLQEKITEIRNGIGSIPDEFGCQAAAMEENLCVNVTGSVREVIKENMEELSSEMDRVNGKLSYIKRYVKFGGKDVDDEAEGGSGANLETVMVQLQEVAGRVADMAAALEAEATDTSGQGGEGSPRAGGRERLGTALLLTEIRKKADSECVQKLSQEMFKSVHNVQRRLLEEQVSPSLVIFPLRLVTSRLAWCPGWARAGEIVRHRPSWASWSASTR